MVYIHSITHDNPEIEKNVNFFADLFVFIVRNLGKLDGLCFDNPLSITEKIIYQIEENQEYSSEYLKPLLNHPFLNSNQFLKNFRNYLPVQDEIERVKALTKKEFKHWSYDNQYFLGNINKLAKELKRSMFNRSLKGIIAILKEQQWSHKNMDELFYHILIIATELLFKGYHKKDLENIFSAYIIKPAKKGFNNQLYRFKELYKSKPESQHFIFQVTGIKIPISGVIKYDDVTFYSGQNIKFKPLLSTAKESVFLKDFFENETAVAMVKIKFNSKLIGQRDAVQSIKRALFYLNNNLGINAQINPYSFFHTPNFKINPGHKWERYGEDYRLNDYELKRLEQNIFTRLKNSSIIFQKHFFKNEFLYEYALSTSKSSDNWLYLETLLKAYIKESSSTRIDEIVSDVLLYSVEKDNLDVLEEYLFNTITNDRNQKTKIEKKHYPRYFEMIKNKERIPIEEIEIQTDNRFIHFLTEKIHSLRNKNDNSSYKTYFLEILSVLKAQRNSFVHSGYNQNNSSIALSYIMPGLLIRFRRNLQDKAIENKDFNFNQVVTHFIKNH
jgi:hypothetical protein